MAKEFITISQLSDGTLSITEGTWQSYQEKAQVDKDLLSDFRPFFRKIDEFQEVGWQVLSMCPIAPSIQTHQQSCTAACWQ